MTQFLPPNLLALFTPREAIPFLPPTDKLPHEKKRLPYGGLSDFMNIFEVNENELIGYVNWNFLLFRKHTKHRHRRELKQKKKRLLER